MHRILVVDDDKTNTKLLKFLLDDEGFEVDAFTSPLKALASAESTDYNLIMLDVIMPDMDGIELCRRLRTFCSAPIIFLSSKGEIEDKIKGLQAGGDDYVAKPFDPNEVLARAWAALRRSEKMANTESSLKTPDMQLDAVENKVVLAHSGKSVNLTPMETRLLRVLISNPGRTLSRDTLMIKVWGYDHDGESNQLDVYMKRLRSKIEPDSRNPQLLLTIRGVGYKYQPSTSRPDAGLIASNPKRPRK